MVLPKLLWQTCNEPLACYRCVLYAVDVVKDVLPVRGSSQGIARKQKQRGKASTVNYPVLIQVYKLCTVDQDTGKQGQEN